jgi:SAM-dependent methyltransferase
MLNEKFAPDSEYYSHLNMPLLSLVQNVPKRILEIGCASGQTLSYLKLKGAELTVGVEISPDVARIAEKRIEVDRVIVGSIEELDLGYPENYFDLIVVGFVIEHVSDPWAVMKKINFLLKKEGQLIGSLPNVRHFSVILPLLLFGKWEYVEEGIMDWTHLRFFTKQTIQNLFKDSNFYELKIIPVFTSRKMKLINLLTCRLFEGFFTYTYDFSALK